MRSSLQLFINLSVCLILGLGLGASKAMADATDLNAALNDSLKENKEIIQSISRAPASEFQTIEVPKSLKGGKVKEAVEIDFDKDEADTKNASNYKDISDIVERTN